MPKTNLTVSVETMIKLKIKRLAKKERRNLSNMVELILDKFLEEHAGSK
jgi:hypothetical protein